MPRILLITLIFAVSTGCASLTRLLGQDTVSEIEDALRTCLAEQIVAPGRCDELSETLERARADLLSRALR